MSRAPRCRTTGMVTVVLVAAVSCGGHATPSSVASPQPPAQVTTGPTPTAQPSPPVTSAPPTLFPPPAGGTAAPPEASAALDASRLLVRLSRVASGLDAPVGVMGSGDGSGRLFVVEQRGRVVIVEPSGSVNPVPFLDISGRVSQDGGERGLLGLAFHPGYEQDGRFYVDYTAPDGTVTISEFRRRDAARADPASERVLLRIAHPRANHNGGQLAFGPDGMLYIGVGDGGGAGDPDLNGQRPSALLAKILRIDVDHGSPYTDPPDNPFVGRPGTRPEIWAWGLRNPWRFSFDAVTGALFIGDVGQDRWEEIDVAQRARGGLDFGWSVMEGRHCYRSVPCDAAGLTAPIAEYGHDQGCAVVGGAVYRGAASPALGGWYVFSDYCSGRIWALRADQALTGTAPATPVLDSGLHVTSFGVGESGEMYLVDAAGALYRVSATAR